MTNIMQKITVNIDLSIQPLSIQPLSIQPSLAQELFKLVLNLRIDGRTKPISLDTEGVFRPLLEYVIEHTDVIKYANKCRESERVRPKALSQRNEMEHLNLLTSREVAVMSFLAKGETNKRIAQELNIAPDTVKKYVANILRKLNVRNRTEAALLYKGSQTFETH